ncbi:fibrinogen alpha chain precursor [Xenopus laevis]|uniref:Fga-prov protein n=1 Tax=Xenopus laevis TaxID=8355 RepID=Q7ZTR1_XENLA|nr:fibrinogen alpha chain precursor [Xenopus laevis]AAH41754.1 Fga-prov protein [Xenopus laevis]
MTQWAALITLLLCFAGSVWSEGEGGIEAQGGSIRGPRIMESKAESDCKQEKNWPICSDEDWGPKCPSGCRIQGLTDKTDKDFAKRIETIKQKFKDGEISYKSIDVQTKQTYENLKNNLIQAQQSDGKYNQASEDLRKKIEYLKLKVSNQVERIKSLQRNIRDQVVEMKRLEVDIDIKIRACKGSCAKNTDYKVDLDSYNNIQKLLLQAETTDLSNEMNSIRVLKMKPIKDSPVDSRYKTLALDKDQEAEFPIFKDINQYSFVLEGTKEEVKGSSIGTSSVVFPSGSGKDVDFQGSKGTQSGTVKGGDQSTKVITESRTVSCTKTKKKRVIITPEGPKEEIIESYSGGAECEKLGKFSTGDTFEAGSDGTRVIKISGSSSLGDISKIPSFEEFLSSSGKKTQTSQTSSSSSSSSSSTYSKGVTHDAFSDLGEDEFDDFSHTGLDSPSFTPIQKEGSSTYTKTVVSSSSRGSTKDGTQFDIKSMKSGPVFDDFGPIQHDNSEEDRPDFQARTVRKETKLVGDYTGKDCDDIRQKHSSGAKSGIFKIRPEGSSKVLTVYCDQDTQLGGWILIQQREDGSVNFNRTWQDYKNGFGSVDASGKGEVWLGNENIHLLTQKDTFLRIELEDWSGEKAYAEYNFQLGSESEGFILKVSQYEGTAGDALIEGSKEDGEYTSHFNMKFSTYDRDSDKWEENCAEMYGGGWWYNNCQASNLNGIFYIGGQYDPRNSVPYEIENGVVWVPFKAADYSLKTVRMKIRPVETSG